MQRMTLPAMGRTGSHVFCCSSFMWSAVRGNSIKSSAPCSTCSTSSFNEATSIFERFKSLKHLLTLVSEVYELFLLSRHITDGIAVVSHVMLRRHHHCLAMLFHTLPNMKQCTRHVCVFCFHFYLYVCPNVSLMVTSTRFLCSSPRCRHCDTTSASLGPNTERTTNVAAEKAAGDADPEAATGRSVPSGHLS
ncbi:unnamed protein product, partial [Trypanosoma congolense IL3000]